VLAAWPRYRKTIDGTAVLEGALERVLVRCPALNEWVTSLTASRP